MATHPFTARVLVGRDDELATLRAGVDAARSGRPNLALLVGQAGIGKTRLADEAAFTAGADGMRVLRGEADASWREPMELWRGVYRALGVDGVGDRLLPSEERRWEHLESLTDALRSCGPVLVVLEDLHWADPIALWVLGHLPRALGDAPVALVATCRDDEPGLPRLDAVRRVARVVALGGLDLDAVRELAAAEATGSVDAVALHARTGGNPDPPRKGASHDVPSHHVARMDCGPGRERCGACCDGRRAGACGRDGARRGDLVDRVR
ncbi:MAG: ATP-binding protein [Solirubrobacteraceae bacterium]